MDLTTFTRAQAEALLAPANITGSIKLLGIRGFSGSNKIDVYDDAIAVVTPDLFFVVPANTDPSVTRPGVAVLQPGTWIYKKGLHGMHHLNLNNYVDREILDKLVKTQQDVAPIAGRILPYWALRQAAPVKILRDGQTVPEFETDPANFPWIDIHLGGHNTTSSLGCQTVRPDYWLSFRSKVFAEMALYRENTIPYVLIDNN